MSDDIDIRDGGVVAVDTASLRGAAERYAVVAADVRAAAADLFGVARRLADLSAQNVPVPPVASSIHEAARRAVICGDDLATAARRLGMAADAYEIVDLRARLSLHAGAGRTAGIAVVLAAFQARHPDAVGTADGMVSAADVQVAAHLLGVANAGIFAPMPWAGVLWPPLGLALVGTLNALPMAGQGVQTLIRALGTGTIAPGSRLVGEASPVRIERMPPVSAVPPDGLADALRRIPQGDARVRVETYTMPDGSSRYAVYLAGTRDFSLRLDGTDPWDLRSDLELYFGRDAAAYDAAQAAMRDAGVPPGARVSLFGHSQGGLIADRLAVQGGYRVSMLVTAGSPTEAVVGEETVSVQLRHTDDIVQSLAAGGSPARVGGSGSMVVERAGDPMPGLQDLDVAAHHLAAYVATATAVDASADPRTTRLRSEFAELRAARSVSVVEYNAARMPPHDGDGVRSPRGTGSAPRPAPSPSPAPVPAPAPVPGAASVPATPSR